jgi:hypothetical protein
MKGNVNREEAHQSEGGLNLLNHFNVGMATEQFCFDTPQLDAGDFIYPNKFHVYLYITIKKRFPPDCSRSMI